jgi:uncharacterized damage-inducible protein DinB
MLNSDSPLDSPVSNGFLAQSRNFLSDQYLPKIERCLEELNDEQLWWRANETSNSIGNLLLHLSGNARQWIACGLGGESDQRERRSEFDERSMISKAKLLSRLKETLADVDAVLSEFDPNLLLKPHKIQGCDVTALEAIFHVVEHFSMHTGQIILLTKLLTESDLHFYEFEGDKPTQRWSSPPPRSS